VEVAEEARRQLVGARGAAGAALVPSGVEHEVVEDELAAALEQVGQVHGAVGALEGVVLLHLDHGQVAALGAEGVAGAGQLLLLGQQVLASGQPLVAADDPGKAHRELLALLVGAGSPHTKY
jgi:hypothetical protein